MHILTIKENGDEKKTLVILVLVICIVAVRGRCVRRFWLTSRSSHSESERHLKATNTNQTSGTGDLLSRALWGFRGHVGGNCYQQELADAHAKTFSNNGCAGDRRAADRRPACAGGSGTAGTRKERDPKIQEYMQSLRENYETIPEVKHRSTSFAPTPGKRWRNIFRR